MKDHPMRQRALAEIHARPFETYDLPTTIFRQAFMSPPTDGKNRKIFSSWCKANGASPPDLVARHHEVDLKDGKRVVWERHQEFITLTWDCPLTKKSPGDLAAFARENEIAMIAAGAELVALVQLDITEPGSRKAPSFAGFDKKNLCVSTISDGKAIVASDFIPQENGAVRIAVFNRGLETIPMGAVVRRLLEIETYRVLALIGFVAAKQTMPAVKDAEDRLVDLTSEMETSGELETSRSLLKTITKLATHLEAISASSQYRMSATRAYYNLINFRLEKLQGEAFDGMMSIEDFLGRRLAPAMRTCDSVENRIAIASKKLSRAADLLRTKVDIQLEAQNHELLESMDRRAKQQFRLQQTVEGLSIAAVSYYVVGLIGYLAKGSQYITGVPAGTVSAISVPFVIVLVWMLVRRIRNQHSK